LLPPVPLRSPPAWRHDPGLSPRERKVAVGAGMARFAWAIIAERAQGYIPL